MAQLVWMMALYVGGYLVVGGIFEATNAKARDAVRRANVRREILMSVPNLIRSILLSAAWLAFVEPLLPFGGYFDINGQPYTLSWLVANGLWYWLWMDAYFYWTHRLLHTRWWFSRVHKYHHIFTDPSALAQAAMHPVEVTFHVSTPRVRLRSNWVQASHSLMGSVRAGHSDGSGAASSGWVVHAHPSSGARVPGCRRVHFIPRGPRRPVSIYVIAFVFCSICPKIRGA